MGERIFADILRMFVTVTSSCRLTSLLEWESRMLRGATIAYYYVSRYTVSPYNNHGDNGKITETNPGLSCIVSKRVLVPGTWYQVRLCIVPAPNVVFAEL